MIEDVFDYYFLSAEKLVHQTTLRWSQTPSAIELKKKKRGMRVGDV
jgi:hypothetical protein